ncbi:hypothetical protein BLOT_005210 [Blomia tropicalis]|nr:hypothetical protein BLOT_005210 [Blomia tropicalis]
MVEHVEGYDKPGSTWLSMCNADHDYYIVLSNQIAQLDPLFSKLSLQSTLITTSLIESNYKKTDNNINIINSSLNLEIIILF